MSSMVYDSKTQEENLSLVEKINSVFLGTRDFKVLAERAVNLMTDQLKHEGIVSATIYRVHPEEKAVYAYAFSSRTFDAVNKLLPKKLTELHVSIDESSNLLVKSILRREEQEGDSLYDFAKPALNETVAGTIQRMVGARHGIVYPLRLKQGKVAGAILFGVEGKVIEDRQRVILEAFRSQLELAFENVLEFERVVERYKRSVAKTFEKTHEEDIPTVRFTLRITPKQNSVLDKMAKEKSVDKASFIRSLIDKAAEG
ncbi:MAG: hypothetical protein Q8Q13_01045 [bacterium]|nr:hypothetical protein [bacterium]